MSMKFIAVLKLLALSLLIICCRSKENKATAQTSSTAKVTLTEYSDYECPTCGYYYPIVDKLEKEFGDSLKIEYKFFPLSMHQYSALAARAAQAARNQGKFRAMHGKLFENQDQWSTSDNPQAIFEGYAKDLGLDMGKFREDLNAAETQRTVMESKKEGEDLGIHSTPTFLINGQIIQQNPRQYKDFKLLLQNYMDSTEEN